MTAIEDMTDQAKSVLLAKAMGWTISWNEYGLGHIVDSNNETIYGVLDDLDEDILLCLYEPRLMALAWLVLNWAWQQHDRIVLVVDEDDEVVAESLKYWTWRLVDVLWKTGDLPPATAIRLWLDKILSLAIEAGLVKLEEEE